MACGLFVRRMQRGTRIGYTNRSSRCHFKYWTEYWISDKLFHCRHNRTPMLCLLSTQKLLWW